jgi:hypothetical protein
LLFLCEWRPFVKWMVGYFPFLTLTHTHTLNYCVLCTWRHTKYSNRFAHLFSSIPSHHYEARKFNRFFTVATCLNDKSLIKRGIKYSIVDAAACCCCFHFPRVCRLTFIFLRQNIIFLYKKLERVYKHIMHIIIISHTKHQANESRKALLHVSVAKICVEKNCIMWKTRGKHNGEKIKWTRLSIMCISRKGLTLNVFLVNIVCRSLACLLHHHHYNVIVVATIIIQSYAQDWAVTIYSCVYDCARGGLMWKLMMMMMSWGEGVEFYYCGKRQRNVLNNFVLLYSQHQLTPN